MTPAALEAIIRPDVKGSQGCPAEARVALVNQHDRFLQLALAGDDHAFPSVACIGLQANLSAACLAQMHCPCMHLSLTALEWAAEI